MQHVGCSVHSARAVFARGQEPDGQRGIICKRLPLSPTNSHPLPPQTCVGGWQSEEGTPATPWGTPRRCRCQLRRAEHHCVTNCKRGAKGEDPPPPHSLLEAPVRKMILQMHTPAARTIQCWSRQTQHGIGVCIWMHLVNGTGNSPSLRQPTPE